MRAKILSESQLQAALSRCDAMMAAALLLSHRAGLRCCEIAALDWQHVTDATSRLSDVIDLPPVASKGRTGAGRLPMAHDLHAALLHLWRLRRNPSRGPVVIGPRCQPITSDNLRRRIKVAYRRAGLSASSHSGRRGLGTKLAQKVNLSGVQVALRHVRPSTTLLYIDAASDADIARAIREC